MLKTYDELKKWIVMMSMVAAVAAEPQVPCLFIFGDSLLDNGNNNNLNTIAHVNFKPYGIDFPLGPTGRFSNGNTVVDIIAQMLGFKDYIPSYLTVKGNQILRGVNFASAAAGIRPETGLNWGDRFTFDEQLTNFKNTVEQLDAILGGREATLNHLGKCIFISGFGNNDFLNNYFLPEVYNTRKLYTLQQYIPLLLNRYTEQLKILYTYGARKLALVGAGPIGCIPFTLVTRSDGVKCADDENRASQMYNRQLRARIDVFNARFHGAQFILIDGYNHLNDVINNAEAYG
ncbi:hypothetical protein SASPL_132665 [Salvia splendens]|uniref:Zeta-carotene desaturase n=1 Tax=Salvia splendens TaxID=180675 RepID=A0A8X8X1K8_SALSN|nr:GDSL esterase/lipase At1g29660-like [Salvia splendens]KAG6405083.1 hypothetical protein SASPL_132665 [Salvia splendens]